MEMEQQSKKQNATIQFVGFDVNLLYINQNNESKLLKFEVDNFSPIFYKSNKSDEYYLKALLNTNWALYMDFPIFSFDEALSGFNEIPMKKRSKSWMNNIVENECFNKTISQQDEELFINNIQHLAIYWCMSSDKNEKNKTYELIRTYNNFVENYTINQDDVEYSNIPTENHTELKLFKKCHDYFLIYMDEFSVGFVHPKVLTYGNFNEFIHPDGTFKSFTEKLYLNDIDYKKFPNNVCTIKFQSIFSPYMGEPNNLKNASLLLLPNNNDERNSVGMMFSDQALANKITDMFALKFSKEKSCHNYSILDSNYHRSIAFVNDVFKYNIYTELVESKFDWHFDTMFTDPSMCQFSTISAILYLRVEGVHHLYYEGLGFENKIKIEPYQMVLIPQNLKHKVYGKGFREFIKTEVIFNFEPKHISYNEDVAKLFDAACHSLRFSVEFPELKSLASRQFNLVNELRWNDRFYVSAIIPKLPTIYIATTICIMERNRNLFNEHHPKYMFTYGSDVENYYFKINHQTTNLSKNLEKLIKLIIKRDLFPTNFSLLETVTCGSDQNQYSISGEQYIGHRLKFETIKNELFNSKNEFLKSLTETPSTLKDSDMFRSLTNENIFHFSKEISKGITFASCQVHNIKIIGYLENDVTRVNFKHIDNSIITVNKFSFKNGITNVSFGTDVLFGEERYDY